MHHRIQIQYLWTLKSRLCDRYLRIESVVKNSHEDIKDYFWPKSELISVSQIEMIYQSANQSTPCPNQHGIQIYTDLTEVMQKVT